MTEIVVHDSEIDRITVLEMIETRNGIVFRLQEPSEFMQPVRPMVAETTLKVNYQTLETMASRLENLAHMGSFPEEEFTRCSRAFYDLIFGANDSKQLAILSNLQTPVLISSRDFTIVWEMLHDGDDFWGLKYSLARQIRSGIQAPLLPQRKHLGKCLMVVNPEGDRELKPSEQQAQLLVRDLNQLGLECLYLSRSQASPERILVELASGKYDIFHYDGHVVPIDDGDRMVSAGQLGEYSLKLSGSYLRGFEIENAARGISVAFLNGCQSAGGVESLAAAFLRKGANIVIGSVYKVAAVGAQVFASRFYDNALQGLSVGDSLRLARNYVRHQGECGNAWACFVMYGNPCCKITGTILPDQLQHPYDISARKIVERCVRLSEASGVVCTPFLFAALLDGDDPLLRDSLISQGVSTEQLRGMFTAARDDEENMFQTHESLSVSHNVLEILELAAKYATDNHRKQISPRDLIRGFAGQGGGSMGRVLSASVASLSPLRNFWSGDNNGLIEEEVFSSLFESNGDLIRRGLNSQGIWVIRAMQSYAHYTGWSFLATPHLLLGLCSLPNGITAALIREQGLDPDVLVQNLMKIFSQTAVCPAEIPLNADSMSKRLQDTLVKAHRLARQDREHGVGEKRLVQAMLSEESETTAALAQLGLNLELMKTSLAQKTGDTSRQV